MVFRRNAAVVAAIIAQVWADASNGFDNPPANGEAGDYSDDPVYYVGNQVEIKWHMNFTDALLKLVQTPSDHESTSSYIIASPTNKTSYEWTVS
ncbi:putative Mid2 domain-containing protein [Seiridium cardinale]